MLQNSDKLLIKFIDENGSELTDVIQVPHNIEAANLKKIVNTDKNLYINGNIISTTLSRSFKDVIDHESINLIKLSAEKSTKAATFCASSYSGHNGPVLKCKIVNEKIAVTVGGDKTVRFWDLVTKTQFLINESHEHWVLHCDSTDDHVISAGMDSKICAYDFKGNLVDSFCKQKKGISALFVYKNTVFSGARDGTIYILQIYNNKFHLVHIIEHLSSISAISANNLHVFTSDVSGKIKVHSIDTFDYVCELTGHTKKINNMALGEKVLITCDDQGFVICYDITDSKFPKMYTVKHEREVLSVAISSNQTSFASCGFDKVVKIWNLQSGTLIAQYYHVNTIYKVMFFEDLIISASKDKMIRMFRLSSNKVVTDLTVDDEIYDFDFKDGVLISALKNSKVGFFH